LAEGYKRRPEETKRQSELERRKRTRENWIHAGKELISNKEINLPAREKEKTFLVQEGNGTTLRKSPIIVSSCEWLQSRVIVIAAPINPVIRPKTIYYSSRNPGYVTVISGILVMKSCFILPRTSVLNVTCLVTRDKGFRLVIGFTGLLQSVITSKCNSYKNLHAL
jgi:hypothetical protein